MTAIGVRVQHGRELTNFIELTKQRLESKGVNKIMTRDVALVKDSEGEYMYIIIEHLLPSFKSISLYVFLISFMLSFLFGNWLLYTGIIGALALLLQEPFRTKKFSFWALKKGLFKYKYFGEVELMTDEEVYRRNIKKWLY